MMLEPRPTRRRWYRFSLRTLLVVVTVMCVYLGWAINWKRQREAFLMTGGVFDHSDSDFPAPILVRAVGAKGYHYPMLWKPSDLQLQEARRLFPEANLMYEKGGYMSLYDRDWPLRPTSEPLP